MNETAKTILAEFEDKMEKAIHHLTDQLRTIRTGRASPALVDTIKADYYGTPTALNQMAHISVPEPRQLVVKPFDQNALKDIEKAILASDLGLTPSSDGKLLRLVLPPLSEEQRHKISAKVKEICEASRVVLRNARRDANKSSDAAKKAGDLTEDLNADLHEEILGHLKKRELEVEEILKNKTVEILED